MTVESATWVSQLNITLPPGGDPLAEGDNHIRLIKTALKNSFPTLVSAFGPEKANTWTGIQTFSAATIFNSLATFNTTDNIAVELVSTSADNSQGPSLSLYRNTANAADLDIIGGIYYYGKDTATTPAKTLYAYEYVSVTDVSPGIPMAQRRWGVTQGAAVATELVLTGLSLYPYTNLGLGLGLSTNRWAASWIDTLTAVTLTVSGTTTLTGNCTLGDLAADTVKIKGTILDPYTALLFSNTSAAAWRTDLGLGTAALANTGTSAHAVPYLDTAASWSEGASWDSGNITFVIGDYIHADNYTASGATYGDIAARFSRGGNASASYVQMVDFVVNSNTSPLEVGSIQVRSTGTLYAETSDYRLKKNIRALTDVGHIIDAIQPRRFTWRSTGDEGIGFVAHELQAVVPDAVGGTKDALHEDGRIAVQGVGASKLVPYLVAEVQSLRARIAALEAV